MDKVDGNEEKNRKLLKNALTDEVPHLSVIKHIHYKFLISGIPRSLLQEIARHQIGISINVLSTRWALHKAFKNMPNEFSEDFVREHYFVSPMLDAPGNEEILAAWLQNRWEEMETMKYLRERGYGNDKLKDFVNENFRTKVFMVISSLALRNMLNQRLYKDAWYVYQYTAKKMVDALPKDHLILYEDILEKRLGNK